MERREQVDKNLEAAGEFFTGLLDTPMERWPENGATIVFVPDDDPALARANWEALDALRARDPDEVGTVHVVTDVAPEPASREERAIG